MFDLSMTTARRMYCGKVNKPHIEEAIIAPQPPVQVPADARALSLLKQGYAPQAVASRTGLTVEAVDDLREQLESGDVSLAGQTRPLQAA
jgi:hypothetical protein